MSEPRVGFNKNRDYLQITMDITSMDLRKFMTDDDMVEIESQSGRYERNGLVLSIVERKSQGDYLKFYEALVESGQIEVADKIDVRYNNPL